jgi:drug/metabolite transporter (DMT)-like permease
MSRWGRVISALLGAVMIIGGVLILAGNKGGIALVAAAAAGLGSVVSGSLVRRYRSGRLPPTI